MKKSTRLNAGVLLTPAHELCRLDANLCVHRSLECTLILICLTILA